MGTIQKQGMMSRMMAAAGGMLSTAFQSVFGSIGEHTTPQFRRGTPMKKVRKKGNARPAGAKQARLVRERKLGLHNPGGVVSAHFRETKQDRMLRIQAEYGYGNCAGKLH